MNRSLLVLKLLVIIPLLFPGPREKVFHFFQSGISGNLQSAITEALAGTLGSSAAPGRPRDMALPARSADSSRDRRKWTFVDGTQVDAVLVSADSKHAQLRLLDLQGVGQVKLDQLATPDRERIQNWVEAEGVNGVAGFPLRLKDHRWPQRWREDEGVALKQVGNSNQWLSTNFQFINAAGVNRKSLESIALICESVDGALNALPLPLPINWGRDPGELRKIVIKHFDTANPRGITAGYWEGETGIVHIFSDALIEPDRQLVVFEFDKPEKVQKYDVIVHEVTHQSTAGLIYMGVPAWVPEGIAEYMAANQFAPACYQFTNTHVTARHHINKGLLGDRIVKDRKMHLTHLEIMMDRDVQAWNQLCDTQPTAGLVQYSQALILIDYFFHRDHRDGAHFRRYLECILSGVPEEEARARHLLRNRSYAQIEQEIIKFWGPLGFTINFETQGDLRDGDVDIDWAAESLQRTIASRRAMGGVTK